jgi:hypothetical protein
MIGNSTGPIQQNCDALRLAIEDRRYQDVEDLLREQRSLVKELSIADPEVRDMLRQAQELTLWSLTMVRIQRNGMERDLAKFTQLKHLEGYKMLPAAR